MRRIEGGSDKETAPAGEGFQGSQLANGDHATKRAAAGQTTELRSTTRPGYLCHVMQLARRPCWYYMWLAVALPHNTLASFVNDVIASGYQSPNQEGATTLLETDYYYLLLSKSTLLALNVLFAMLTYTAPFA
jgi:hypothetical protein